MTCTPYVGDLPRSKIEIRKQNQYLRSIGGIYIRGRGRVKREHKNKIVHTCELITETPRMHIYTPYIDNNKKYIIISTTYGIKYRGIKRGETRGVSRGSGVNCNG